MSPCLVICYSPRLLAKRNMGENLGEEPIQLREQLTQVSLVAWKCGLPWIIQRLNVPIPKYFLPFTLRDRSRQACLNQLKGVRLQAYLEQEYWRAPERLHWGLECLPVDQEDVKDRLSNSLWDQGPRPRPLGVKIPQKGQSHCSHTSSVLENPERKQKQNQCPRLVD